MMTPRSKQGEGGDEDVDTTSPSTPENAASSQQEDSSAAVLAASTRSSSSEGQRDESHCPPPPQTTTTPSASQKHHAAGGRNHHAASNSYGGGSSGDMTTFRAAASASTATLMREQDADLLESIHMNAANDSCTGQTPLIQSRSESIRQLARSNSGAMPEFLLEQPAAGAGLFLPGASNQSDVASIASAASAGGGVGPSSAAAAAATAGLSSWMLADVSSENGELRGESLIPDGGGSLCSGGGAMYPPLLRARRALSGEVWSSAGQEPEEDNNRAPSSSSPDKQQLHHHLQHPPSELQFFQHESCTNMLDHAAVGAGGFSTPKSQRGIARTESMDRRLNEAAQFAEAVGEVVIICGDDQRSEICTINIEDDDNDTCDDSDDDEDEGATEIHLTQKEPPVEAGAASGDAVAAEQQEPGAIGVSIATPASSSAVVVDSAAVTKEEQEVVRRLKSKSRPVWPFNPVRGSVGFLDKLGAGSISTSTLQQQEQNFVYKGIHSNPPEIVKRGTARGNYAQLHRKAWLEVSDKYHRYGKNLRLYYRHWESLGCPTNMFFDWLDSKGEAAGQPLPELAECPRSKLDADTVLYISTPEVSEGYALHFVVDDDTGRAKVLDVDGDAVRTGTEGWIFVIRDNVLYGAQKITSVSGHSKQRFHHSSFFGGKAVAAAGIFLTDDAGYLSHLYPHSGHYRPGEADMQRMLYFLYTEGVDLQTVEFDMQQILHVAREKESKGGGEKTEKLKKLESLCLAPAVMVANYLAHKARFIGEGIFAQIHWIRKANVTSVREAIELLDGDSRSKASQQQ